MTPKLSHPTDESLRSSRVGTDRGRVEDGSATVLLGPGHQFTMEGLSARMDAEGCMHIEGAPVRIENCTLDATDWDGSVRICLHDGGDGCPGDSTEPMSTGQVSWFRFWCTENPGWFEGALS